MIKLKSIRIEGMHNVVDKTYDLSNFTYFYGNNGAGKSTILQAIQLALLGYIPGTNKTNKAIYTHANTRVMRVTLTINNNDKDIVIIREYYAAGKDTIKCECDIPDNFDLDRLLGGLQLPIFDFNEFNKLTANKLKDWFINFLPNDTSNDCVDIKKEIKSATAEIVKLDYKFLDDLIDHSMSIFAKNTNGVEALRQINEYLKDMLSFKKQELQRSESTIQTLTFDEDVSLLNVDPVTLQSELDMIRKSAIDSQGYNQQLANKARLEDRLNEHIRDFGPFVAEKAAIDTRVTINNEQITKLTAEISDAELVIQNADNRLADLQMKKATLNSEMATKQTIIDKGGVCPYTSVVCDSIVSLIDKLTLEIGKANEELDAIDKKIADVSKAKNEVVAKLNEYRQSIQTIKQSNRDIENAYSVYNLIKEDIAAIDVPEGVTTTTIQNNLDKWNSRIDEINDILIKTAANAKYIELYDKLASEKMIINEHILVVKELIKLTDVNGLQSKIMNAPFVNLEDTVTKYLSKCWSKPNVSAKFNIDGGANNFNFGILCNNEYISFDTLSSGEKCIYTLALILSLIESSNGDMKVILIDDLFDHLDLTNFAYVFENLVKIKDIQFIFAGVEAPFKPDTIDLQDVTYYET